jgi:hypothetical protein
LFNYITLVSRRRCTTALARSWLLVSPWGAHRQAP